jgi:hypothetical protein
MKKPRGTFLSASAVVVGLLFPYLHLAPGRRPKIKAVPKEKGRSGKGVSDHGYEYWLSWAVPVKDYLSLLVLFRRNRSIAQVSA